ncbi:MAG: hypothetical protein RI897_1543 [Verrucomicrobiota bacterium]
MEDVAAVSAVLLAFAGHAIDDGFLGAVIQRVDSGVEELLECGVVGFEERFLGPGEAASADADLGDAYGLGGGVDMELEPAEGFEVEGFEVVDAFFADEAGPAIEVGIGEAMRAGVMGFMDEEFDRGAGGGFDTEEGPADHLFVELEREDRAVVGRGGDFVDLVCGFFGAVFLDDREGIGDAHIEIIARWC